MLFTIGYEGSQVDEFVQTLVDANVNQLIDVRERAQSRKPGFSKTRLSELLQEAGISYLHLRELGDPKLGREAARRGDWKEFDQIYKSVLKTEAAKNALDIIQATVLQTNACLLCYERDYETCHRKYISDEIDSRVGTESIHLGVTRFERAA